MLEDYPGLPVNNADFVHENLIKSGGASLKAHTLAWLAQHPKVAKRIDTLAWQAQLRNAYIWLPTIKKNSIRVHTLTSSGLLEVAKLATYHEDTPEVVRTADWSREHAPVLNRLFRLTIKASQTNIQIVNKLLKKIGYESKIDHKQGGRGEQVKIWAITNRDDCDRKSIWAALERKWADLLNTENVDTEGDSAPVDSTCNIEIPPIQVESTAQKHPPDPGGEVPKIELDRGALSQLADRILAAASAKDLNAICNTVSPEELDRAWAQIYAVSPDRVIRLYELLDMVAC